MTKDLKRLKDKINIACVNARVHPNLAERMSINQFPAIRYFMSTEEQRTEADAREYNINEVKFSIFPLVDDMIVY